MRQLRCSTRLLTILCAVALCLPANPLGPVGLSASADRAAPDWPLREPATLGVQASARLPSADHGLPSAIHQPQARAAADAAAEGGQVPDEVAGVPGVTADWWATVQEQIRQDSYTLSPDPGDDGAPTYRGHNLAHNFDLTLAPDGLRLASPDGPPDASLAGEPAGEPAGESWTWSLRFTGLGYEGQVQPVRVTAEITTDGNRVELQRDGVTEWYVNDDRGLKQGFTIASAPVSSPAGRLVLEMALDTDLITILAGDRQAIDFALPDGNVIALRYTELYVTDATGRELPAHLTLSPGVEEKIVRIVISDAGATYPLTVDPLVTSPSAWTVVGVKTGDEFAFAVATAGDLNGDGYDDVVISARDYNSVGAVYVYYGSETGLGTTPWIEYGENVDDYFGDAVGTAGDVNSDGYDDLIVGAYYFGAPTNYGKVYVYYGSASGLDATSPWTREGSFGAQYFGDAVGTAGDVNGDGYDDIIIGASGLGGGTGAAYVFPGSASGVQSGYLWFASGENAWDTFGKAVGTAGDVNGDGYTDIVVGAPGVNNFTGAVYVYHGSPSGLSDTPYALAGEDELHKFGQAVGTAGDVNGDGYADIIVGAHDYEKRSDFHGRRGKAYVYHGSGGGLSGAPAWTAIGEADDDRLGWSVGTAGDFNGDGYDDVVVSAYHHYDPGFADWTGKVYAYPGSSAGLAGTPAWTATGENYDWLGWSVGSAGDVNGDRRRRHGHLRRIAGHGGRREWRRLL